VSDELVRGRQEAVLIARLNRPDARNALTPELIRGIGAAIVDAEAYPEIRAIVLTGTGDRAPRASRRVARRRVQQRGRQTGRHGVRREARTGLAGPVN
jgi:enoyl-CoA hydratase/carnithine racemase